MTDLVVGCPVWDRSWCLDLWFDSVEANVDPRKTGLCFVVPATDTATRDVIARRAEGFAWVEVLRDRHEQFGREDRVRVHHKTLASARNQILSVVGRARPKHFISWDSDLLIPEGAVDLLRSKKLPLVTVWTWLNRQQPRMLRHYDGKSFREVLWQETVRATAMSWDRRAYGRANHFPDYEFNMRAHGTWRCDVALAFKLMTPEAYGRASYNPHHDGEDLPFNWLLEQRGVPRYCCGDVMGVHLYSKAAKDEIELGWPDVMSLAEQRPLAATWTKPRPVEFEAFGFYPVQDMEDKDGSGLAA